MPASGRTTSKKKKKDKKIYKIVLSCHLVQHAITPPVPPGDLAWLCHCSLGLVFC
jgi:hypothetical protein